MINCLTGISMFNMANLNYYGIMEMDSTHTGNDGIIIDGDAAVQHAGKNTISGSIDGFLRGVTLGTTSGVTTNNRILANITNTATPIKAGDSAALSTAFILTPINYPAGSGGVDIGTQIPTDVTVPHEAKPVAPASGSRRVYVDMNSSDDLMAEKTDGTAIDLEAGLRNYQKPTGSTITGNGISTQTVYSFSIPSIPPGKGVRAKVFWQCTTCSGNKTFSWAFGGTTITYAAYTGSSTALTSAEVRIFNDPNSQANQTMFTEPLIQSTTLLSAGSIATPAEGTNAAVNLVFRFFANNTETIAPKGFIVEAIQ